MKLYKNIDEFKTLPLAVATTGTFDGVHIGHRTILNRLIRVAQIHKGESVLLTFHPHPRQILQPDVELKLISTIDERIALLEEIGIDHLIVHPFDKAFSRTSSLEFVRNILVQRIGVKKLVIGYDHHFGRNRKGSFEHLKEYGPLYGFDVEEIPAQDVDEIAVSSTKIRKALGIGDMERVNEFLGYTYSMEAEIVKGDQLGRTIGYPTANCQVIDKTKILPTKGVYAIRADLDGISLNGMCNIGIRPTVAEVDEKRVEVHLFNFNQEIYGRKIRVFFEKRIRNEQRFSSIQDLKNQLNQDEQNIREYFAK